jgi:hypothetical protein
MTVADANAKAMELAKKDGKAFFLLSQNEQARRIGCAWATWSKTEFYKTAKKRGEQSHRQAAPKKTSGSPSVVSFTSEMEAVIGEGRREEMLNKLTAEQNADREPSPLDPDPPGSMPRKVFSPKRL